MTSALVSFLWVPVWGVAAWLGVWMTYSIVAKLWWRPSPSWRHLLRLHNEAARESYRIAQTWLRETRARIAAQRRWDGR